MYKEQITIETANETTKKSEVQENHEAPRNIESPEDLRQSIIIESEKETGSFKKECTDSLAQAETRAEKDGLTIDREDKEPLQALTSEANAARAELLTEIEPLLPLGEEDGEPPLFPEKIGKNVSAMEERTIENTEQTLEKKEAESEHGSVEYYIQKSKIADKVEALHKLMAYAGVSSEEDLRNKLKEKDKNGDNVVNIFTPEFLNREKKPSLRLLRKIRDGGDALGYTFVNTPEYEAEIDNLTGRLMGEGKTEDAHEVESIFAEAKRDFENEKEKSEFREINPELKGMNEDNEKQYIEKQKNLPPNEVVHLYHGLNGSYEKVMAVLDSSSHGVEQHSGPTFSFIPVGQFWKKGDMGFRYSLKRNQIEFPGEKNPNAVVKIEDSGKTGIICNESKSLPLDQFEAEIMRSIGTFPDFDAEKKIKEKLRVFSEERNTKRSAQNN